MPSPTCWMRYVSEWAWAGVRAGDRWDPGDAGVGEGWGRGGQSRGQAPADADLPLAEGAGPGAGGTHRAVPAEAEPEPDRAQRAPGGAAGVGQRGGNGPRVQGPGLGPLRAQPGGHGRLWSPWLCPDAPSPPRSRSCATRSPCGTTCSTSTPPRQRRASPPPPPPHREWGGSLSHHFTCGTAAPGGPGRGVGQESLG